MSTRSITQFTDSSYTQKPIATVYRHSDGYPEGAGKDIMRFLRACKKLKDSRLNDASYLAAKYVVFLADTFNQTFEKKADGEWGYTRNKSKLEFLSVGIVTEDFDDFAYKYVIDCGVIQTNGLPMVTAYDYEGNVVEIPKR